MRVRIIVILAALAPFVFSGRSAIGQPIDPAVQAKAAAVPSVPVWEGAANCDDVSPGPARPVSTAIPVSKLYLVAASKAFTRRDPENPRRRFMDFGKEPHVCVHDGSRLSHGRLVDYDSDANVFGPGYGLVLIRMDWPLAIAPARLSEAASTLDFMKYVRLMNPPSDRLSPGHVTLSPHLQRVDDCFKDLAHMDVPIDGWLCGRAATDGFLGAVALDADMNVVGLLSNDAFGSRIIGPSAAGLRRFVDGYFNSWGRAVPDPERPWKTKPPR
jgi:hypothetical protein